MTHEHDMLIHGYLDDSLSDEEFSQLADLLRNDAEFAREFARSAILHDRLHSEWTAVAFDDGSTAIPLSGGDQETHDDAASIDRNQNWRNGPRMLLAVAACFLLMAALIASRGRLNGTASVKAPSVDAARFATVAQCVGVVWKSPDELQHGTRLGSGRIAISDGFLRLQFDDGVDVTLEGPADYELMAPGRTRLHSGLLTASVPSGAEGFQVDASGARVTDLGTAFGIRLDQKGNAEVSVFDGEVDVAEIGTDKNRLLKEGEALKIGETSGLVPVQFNSAPYEKVWPISSGIVGSSGAFRFTPPWPRRLGLIRSNKKIFVRPEGYRTSLSDPLNVNISLPGTYRLPEDLTPATIAPSTPFRTFLLHFRPEEDGRGTRVNGSITFDRPVLGLIVQKDELATSKKLLSLRGVDEFREERQLEFTGLPDGDVVALSEDRRTVELSLSVPSRFSDLVRVILDDTPTVSTSSSPRLPKSPSRDPSH